MTVQSLLHPLEKVEDCFLPEKTSRFGTLLKDQKGQIIAFMQETLSTRYQLNQPIPLLLSTMTPESPGITTALETESLNFFAHYRFATLASAISGIGISLLDNALLRQRVRQLHHALDILPAGTEAGLKSFSVNQYRSLINRLERLLTGSLRNIDQPAQATDIDGLIALRGQCLASLNAVLQGISLHQGALHFLLDALALTSVAIRFLFMSANDWPGAIGYAEQDSDDLNRLFDALSPTRLAERQSLSCRSPHAPRSSLKLAQLQILAFRELQEAAACIPLLLLRLQAMSVRPADYLAAVYSAQHSQLLLLQAE